MARARSASAVMSRPLSKTRSNQCDTRKSLTALDRELTKRTVASRGADPFCHICGDENGVVTDGLSQVRSVWAQNCP